LSATRSGKPQKRATSEAKGVSGEYDRRCPAVCAERREENLVKAK
jgi:hypothetical protein